MYKKVDGDNYLKYITSDGTDLTEQIERLDSDTKL